MRLVLRAVPDRLEGGERSTAGVRQGAEVLLGGGDLTVAEAVHDDLQVGAAGEQPRGVGTAQVVEADLLADAGSLDRRAPDPGAEHVAGDRCAGSGGEQQVDLALARGDQPLA